MGKKKLFLALLICVLLTGCTEQAQVQNDTEDQEMQRIQIGLSFDSFVIERWTRDRDVFVSTARELGRTSTYKMPTET